MPKLAYVNVFAEDIGALSRYYAGVFDLRELEAQRSPIFCALDAGTAWIGFNAHDAYALLELSAPADRRGVRFMLSFEVDSRDEVARRVARALAHGGHLVQAAHDTAYGAWQAVLEDPEGNVLRISHTQNVAAGSGSAPGHQAE